MHVTEHLQDGVLVLTISGRFTFYSRKVFQAILKNAGTTKVRQILVNLQGVSFIDSSALGFLALGYLNLIHKQIHMCLVSPPQPVREMLELSNFPKFIPTYNTEDEALQNSPP